MKLRDNLWHDVMWEYLAFTNPEQAIEFGILSGSKPEIWGSQMPRPIIGCTP